MGAQSQHKLLQARGLLGPPMHKWCSNLGADCWKTHQQMQRKIQLWGVLLTRPTRTLAGCTSPLAAMSF